MRLKSIHFSGFKSFVDSTTFKLPANIIGIVGPNGCGKSNVIDAVRWVMGESSAKYLRGDNMADVIFNGSSGRQPVGKATVKLTFDNSSGRAPGAYSQYAEIEVQRSLSRDGQSEYFLNNVRCRRKDITEIFLGTGLGPRSYSIIEQGMVSRIVEAKPEDLRAFVEEAAGISKYKEKRRETENRIRRTRENLDRVIDISSELETQLKRLDRQSKQAKRFQVLKQEQRELNAQTLALRWQQFEQQSSTFNEDLSTKQTALDGFVKQQRSAESEVESLRSQLTKAQEALNRTQANFYSVGADISSIEQKIRHEKETQQSLLNELNRVETDISQIQQRFTRDQQERDQLNQGKTTLTPQVERLRADYQKLQSSLNEKEAALQSWQREWEQFQARSHQSVQKREVLKAKTDHLTTKQQDLSKRKEQIELKQTEVESEQQSISPDQLRIEVQQIDSDCQELEQKITEITHKINELRSEVRDKEELIKNQIEHSSEFAGKLESLKELQKAALGETDEQLNSWLNSNQLQDNARLSSLLKVEKGWEKAVDTALSKHSAAVCVDNLAEHQHEIQQIEQVSLNFIESSGSSATSVSQSQFQPLLNKIDSSINLAPLLSNVFVAESVTEAMEHRNKLLDGQCFITRDGTRVGINWISIARQQDVESGLIERQAQISALEQQLSEIRAQIAEHERGRDSARNQLGTLDADRAQYTQQLSQSSSQRSILHKQLGQQEQKLRELTNRRQQLDNDLKGVNAGLIEVAQSLEENQTNLSSILSSVEANEQDRQLHENQRETLKKDFDSTKSELEQVRDLLDNDNIRLEKISTALEAIEHGLSRTQKQLETLAQRQLELQKQTERPEDHDAQNQSQLAQLQQSKQTIDTDLRQAREKVAVFDGQISKQDRHRIESEQKAAKLRSELEAVRLDKQAVIVKQQGVKEQLQSLELDLASVIENIPEDADLAAYQQNLEHLEGKITRLGTVNLLAIEEYEEQQQRKEYLDEQHDDLAKALATLEEVMGKIDRETKQRFSETFEGLNSGFKEYFPKLFGGGSASLELTDDDLLTAGVTVMARPPGKRNSTIHLLSGGEKALTAVSLLFSLFQLNPSPFCILDEVDAPLDDANVERYCRTLVQLAEKTQLMFITHNKITMEYADLLIGVTMQEPGVSRLVTVDVEKALEMAEQG